MLPTHLTSSTDGLCGLSVGYTWGTKGVRYGEAALVFLCSVTSYHNSVAENTHSLAYSSLDQKPVHGMTGFSAQDLVKIKVRPCSHLELSVLFHAACDRRLL